MRISEVLQAMEEKLRILYLSMPRCEWTLHGVTTLRSSNKTPSVLAKLRRASSSLQESSRSLSVSGSFQRDNELCSYLGYHAQKSPQMASGMQRFPIVHTITKQSFTLSHLSLQIAHMFIHLLCPDSEPHFKSVTSNNDRGAWV